MPSDHPPSETSPARSILTNHSTDRTKGGNDAAGHGGDRQGQMSSQVSDQMSGQGRTLDAPSRNSIENRLKSMYDEVASEPVPDRFLDLLNKLERSEGPDGSAGGSGGDAR